MPRWQGRLGSGVTQCFCGNVELLPTKATRSKACLAARERLSIRASLPLSHHLCNHFPELKSLSKPNAVMCAHSRGHSGGTQRDASPNRKRSNTAQNRQKWRFSLCLKLAECFVLLAGMRLIVTHTILKAQNSLPLLLCLCLRLSQKCCFYKLSMIWLFVQGLERPSTSHCVNTDGGKFHRAPPPDKKLQAVNGCCGKRQPVCLLWSLFVSGMWSQF